MKCVITLTFPKLFVISLTFLKLFDHVSLLHVLSGGVLVVMVERFKSGLPTYFNQIFVTIFAVELCFVSLCSSRVYAVLTGRKV